VSELHVLRRSAPATAAPSEAARARALALLEGRIRSERHADRPVARTPPLPRRALVPVLAAAAVAAAAVVAVVATRTTEPAAAAVLERAAEAARGHAPPLPGPGEYLYVRSVDASLATRVDEPSYSVLLPHVREVWLGPGSGRMRTTTGAPTFLSERDRARWIAAGRPPLPGATRVGDTRIRSRRSAVPADPAAAYAHLEAQARTKDSSFAWAMFQLVGGEFRHMLTTPAQRAALYAAAARVPGIDLVGDVTDRVGRSGVAIAVLTDDATARLQLVVDPGSGRLLAEEEVVLEGNAFAYPAGTVIAHTTYTHVELVDGVDARPAGAPEP